MRTYYTAAEAAERLGMTLRAMREACASGDVPSVRERTAYYIEESDLMAYGAKRRTGRELE